MKKREVRERLSAVKAMRGFKKFYKNLAPESTPYNVDDESTWIGPCWLGRMFEEVGDLDTFIKKLQLILRNAKKEGFERVDVHVDYHDDDYSGRETDVILFGWRPETAAEVKKRRAEAKARSDAAKKAAAKRKKTKAKKERADYERLKKKFEK